MNEPLGAPLAMRSLINICNNNSNKYLVHGEHILPLKAFLPPNPIAELWQQEGPPQQQKQSLPSGHGPAQHSRALFNDE